ncbi:hypothetical protein EX30DRAFT_370086 [Ascodesmis nigricans]|uniref:Uncharacterized protein n=1 Tax=Ascodesmis nigricans TaxID=341454 RepID=A0A4S2N1T9_9PEZI|nr:hypothetical protein EX30DRAFT_370086 [Ascodesmis nigricans]
MASTIGKPTSSSSTATPSTDVLQSRINQSLSAARNLVASWLPAPPAGATVQTSDPVTLDTPDSFPTSSTSSRLGVGAQATKPGANKGSNEALRRVMMGRKKRDGGHTAAVPRPKTEDAKKAESDEEDEEDSKSALVGKGKKRRPEAVNKNIPRKRVEVETREGNPGGETIPEKSPTLEVEKEEEEEKQENEVSNTTPRGNALVANSTMLDRKKLKKRKNKLKRKERERQLKAALKSREG